MIGMGTYLLKSADAVRDALELGYRHFDCALLLLQRMYQAGVQGLPYAPCCLCPAFHRPHSPRLSPGAVVVVTVVVLVVYAPTTPLVA
jgi:hypothetical protein